jgi:SAM-dependent methyltransferase
VTALTALTDRADRTDRPDGHDWHEAGEAWGRRSLDWAYLAEPGATLVYETVLRRLGVDESTALLDVGCGAGGAARLAAQRGASVTGIDASTALLEVARDRTPAADFFEGSMFDLPFAADAFDVVVSFNGIFAGCDAALAEVRRVIRPRGRVALTFWGDFTVGDHLPALLALTSLQAERDASAAVRNAGIGEPGVAEKMLGEEGFCVVERGSVPYVNEWPTVDLAVRALSSSGPATAARRRAGPHHLEVQLREAIEPFASPLGGVRLASPWDYVIALA